MSCNCQTCCGSSPCCEEESSCDCWSFPSNCGTVMKLNKSCCDGCCSCSDSSCLVKGRFGIAWISETPCNPQCEPCGWQIEFTDTPCNVEQKCRQMVEWVSCPPVPDDDCCSCKPKKNKCCPKKPSCKCKKNPCCPEPCSPPPCCKFTCESTSSESCCECGQEKPVCCCRQEKKKCGKRKKRKKCTENDDDYDEDDDRASRNSRNGREGDDNGSDARSNKSGRRGSRNGYDEDVITSPSRIDNNQRSAQNIESLEEDDVGGRKSRGNVDAIESTEARRSRKDIASRSRNDIARSRSRVSESASARNREDVDAVQDELDELGKLQQIRSEIQDLERRRKSSISQRASSRKSLNQRNASRMTANDDNTIRGEPNSNVKTQILSFVHVDNTIKSKLQEECRKQVKQRKPPDSCASPQVANGNESKTYKQPSDYKRTTHKAQRKQEKTNNNRSNSHVPIRFCPETAPQRCDGDWNYEPILKKCSDLCAALEAKDCDTRKVSGRSSRRNRVTSVNMSTSFSRRVRRVYEPVSVRTRNEETTFWKRLSAQAFFDTVNFCKVFANK